MTRAATQEERWDHDRDLRKADWRPGDPLPLHQRLPLARLIGYCEGLANSGLLGLKVEFQLRQNIAEALAAFNMPSKTEGSDAQA